MRTVTYRLADLRFATINIGRAGENEHTQIVFDCMKAFEQYPRAVAALTVTPPEGDPYPAVTSREDDCVIWDVTASDLAHEGNGELQLTFTENEKVMKTYICKTVIDRSIEPIGQAPEPIENFIVAANTALNAIPQTIINALEDAKESGEFDGVGIVSIEKTSTAGLVDTYTITLTDESTKTFTVTNGADGQNGVDGQDGVGILSIVKTSTSGLVDTYTITFTNNTTTTFTVTNGRDGETPVIDVNGIIKGDGQGNLSAAVAGTDFGTYSKPNGGIPAEDIASGVIPDITGKADKVTSATSGNFAGLDSNGNLVDSGKKASDFVSPSEISGFYTKPAEGIPAADLASGVIPDISGKADKTDTVLNTTLSRGRKANTTVGTGSFAFGDDVEASGLNSTAEGISTRATGVSSHAEGASTLAQGVYSHSEGVSTTAGGYSSHAEGVSSSTVYDGGHAEGLYTQAKQAGAHAEGGYTESDGYCAHTEGYYVKATNAYAHAEGEYTTASGLGAHSEGKNSTASGDYSHVEGEYTIANHRNQHVFGMWNVADDDSHTVHNTGKYVEIVGNGGGDNYRSNARTLDWYGNEELAGDLTIKKGTQYETKLSDKANKRDTVLETTLSCNRKPNTTVGYNSIAFGYNAEASDDYTTAIGQSAKATANNAHAEGLETTASGTAAHAEGARTTASGSYTHSENYGTTASGPYSHAEGQSTIASGTESHAEGYATKAEGQCAHAEGEGGTVTETIRGESVTIQSSANGKNSHVEGTKSRAAGEASHAEGYHTRSTGGLGSHAEGQKTNASGPSAHAEGNETSAGGTSSHAEGYNTSANNTNAHAEGGSTIASGISSHAEGGASTHASGDYSHAEGNHTLATAEAAHAEGKDSTVAGAAGHAEGTGTNVSAASAHAEGQGTTASGNYAHAEGSSTVASGLASHAEGSGNTALGSFSHVGGVGGFASGQSSFSHGNGGAQATGNGAWAGGQGTQAKGDNSIAHGGGSRAEDYGAVAVGMGAAATGQISFAQGSGVEAIGACSHVIGEYNVVDRSYYDSLPEWEPGTYVVGAEVKKTSGLTVKAYRCKTANSDETFDPNHWDTGVRGDKVFIIGNGVSGSGGYRSNAMAVGWDGDVRINGDVYVGCNNDSTGGEKLLSPTNLGTGNTASGQYALAAAGIYCTASGTCATASGMASTASGDYSYARGSGGATATGEGATAVGAGVSANGRASVAFGMGNAANGIASVAIGSGVVANGSNSAAFGGGTRAEGETTFVIGSNNYVEDYVATLPEWVPGEHYVPGNKIKRTLPNPDYDAEENNEVPENIVTGYICTYETSEVEFVEHNWSTNFTHRYAFIVGNGELEQSSNAAALEWTGDMKLAGNVYVGCNNDSTGGTKLVKGTDYATDSAAGVVKVNSQFGLWVRSSPNQDTIMISKAAADTIKSGVQNYQPIVPSYQKYAVFYGLAEAAGDTTQKNTSATPANEIGTYTPAAKTAIQTMLGVEAGVSFTETVSGSTPAITALPNVKYKCGEVSTLTITAPANGTTDIWFTSGSTATLLTTTGITFPDWFDPTLLEPETVYEIIVTDGFGEVATWARPVTA